MRSPEEVAETIAGEFPMEVVPAAVAESIRMALVDHVRERDAEHDVLRREEREKAFDRGAATERRHPEMAGAPAFFAARRAAVESAEGAGEEQHGD